MLFYEFPFLFVFLPLALLGYYGLPARWPAARLGWLLVASCLFYASSSLLFLPLLLLSTCVDYACGKGIAASESTRVRRGLLLLSLTFNLGSLGYFKYAGFLTSAARDLGLGAPLLEAALPIGISFYTFQSLSYTVDIYRRQVEPARSLVEFAAFVTLFPQLIAGPIVRYSQLSVQLRTPEGRPELFADGVQLLVRGLAKKLLFADPLAALAAPLFELQAPGAAEAWISMVLYAGQIYWDFSGYSDMAIGLGRMLGFEFPVNFDSPYVSTSFREFWRRWHISLSAWLRDYLYVPLGGNRKGPRRTYFNLAATMLLGGLWHGASWNFVLWGAAHGSLLAIERALGPYNPLSRGPRWLRRTIVFAVVVLTWVPFKFVEVQRTGVWLGAMLLGRGGLGHLPGLAALGALGVVLVAWFTPNTNSLRVDPRRWRWQAALTLALLALALFVGYGRVGRPPFLYFRF